MDDVTQRQYTVGNVVHGGRDTSSPPGCKKPVRKKDDSEIKGEKDIAAPSSHSLFPGKVNK